MSRNSFVDVRFVQDDPREHGLDSLETSAANTTHSVRSHLLSKSIKITPELFPELASGLSSLRETMALAEDVDCFVDPNPAMQAHCYYHNDESASYSVVLSSGIIERLTVDELRFVVGHEIGHFIFKHNLHPTEDDYESLGDKLAALALSRSAEISADRVGMLACRSLEVACSAMIKVASGLGSEFVRCDVPSILQQFRDICAGAGAKSSIWDTHPMIPLRVRALVHFSPILKMVSHNSLSIKEGLERIDASVLKDFSKSTGNIVELISERSLSGVAVWGLMALFVADGVLTKNEQQVMLRQLGEVQSKKVLKYLNSRPGDIISEVDRKLEEASESALMAPRLQRIALLKQFEQLVVEASGGGPAQQALMRVKELLTR